MDYLLFVFNKKIENMEKNPGNEKWFSYYAIIKNDCIIGLIGPKGKPINDGIEIGYGINEKYSNQGYMSEAIKIFCDYYFNNENIECIIADTSIDNIGSQKVLLKNKFLIKEKNNENITFELRKISLTTASTGQR
jgi:RimJ/RimL family protein N-acetyltransferase